MEWGKGHQISNGLSCVNFAIGLLKLLQENIQRGCNNIARRFLEIVTGEGFRASRNIFVKGALEIVTGENPILS